eukprot:Hpha_TRINITY_DN13663_c0_g1::TRINITY_DN13663_c0_g1_i1::g.122604::m.122604
MAHLPYPEYIRQAPAAPLPLRSYEAANDARPNYFTQRPSEASLRLTSERCAARNALEVHHSEVSYQANAHWTGQVRELSRVCTHVIDAERVASAGPFIKAASPPALLQSYALSPDLQGPSPTLQASPLRVLPPFPSPPSP